MLGLIVATHLMIPSALYQSNFYPVTGVALLILFIISVSRLPYISSRFLWYCIIQKKGVSVYKMV